MEDVLAQDLESLNVPYERQFRFDPHRQWKADFLLLGSKILVEVQGGSWSGGRHVRGKGYEDDHEKFAAAWRAGYLVMTFTSKQVQNKLLELDGTYSKYGEAAETAKAAYIRWGDMDGR